MFVVRKKWTNVQIKIHQDSVQRLTYEILNKYNKISNVRQQMLNKNVFIATYIVSGARVCRREKQGRMIEDD